MLEVCVASSGYPALVDPDAHDLLHTRLFQEQVVHPVAALAVHDRDATCNQRPVAPDDVACALGQRGHHLQLA